MPQASGLTISRTASPRDILLGAQAVAGALPVCDHYCGVEARMRKSLQLQREMMQEFGACVFDVTLDCEDGAPVGGELAHAQMVVALAHQAHDDAAREAPAMAPRVAVRVHAVDHPAFDQDVAALLGQAAPLFCHVMIPKVESVADVARAVSAVDAACQAVGRATPMPLQVLIESPAAVHQAFAIAAHPRVQSLSFGLMDFVSAHGGAIPDDAMGARGQFNHPLVLRAKLEIASACHAYGKVPAHCVVTEFNDAQAMQTAAGRAARELGYTRMWSIHPSQIRPILAAMAPSLEAVARAAELLLLAQQADWAPISFEGRLHDRASYRYFWQVLERAHQTGRALPPAAQAWFSPVVH
jgi:citrate lyase subunit beta/citryl-CoA lyase